MTDPGSTSVRADLRALPQPVWFLLAGSFVNRFGSGPGAGTAVYAASPRPLWGGCVVLGALASTLMLSSASRPRYATTASRSTSAA